MNVKVKDQGGYTLPMALIILSLLFTIAGIAVAGLAQQSKETRYFKDYQIFLLDCKTAMAECEATAMADPEGLFFPQRGNLQNASYACYVEKTESTGYTLLLEVKGGAYAQTYEGQVVLEKPMPAERTGYFQSGVYLSGSPEEQPPFLEEPLEEEPQESDLPQEPEPDPQEPEPPEGDIPPEETPPEEPQIKVLKVLWSIK